MHDLTLDQTPSNDATPPAPAAGVLVRTGVDNTVRWHLGQRFEHLFEARVDALQATDPTHLAVDGPEGTLTYGDLDARANQLARVLRRQGFRAGDRLALLFDKSMFSYIATLAVLKLHAAYVPLDASFPADRIAFIAEDARVAAILSLARYREHLGGAGVPVLHLDGMHDAIDSEAANRLSDVEIGIAADDLAYIIYTSGSTGRPKGVPIEHPSIVNFIQVAAETYGITATDRMYQGLTIAFDFAVEEIWIPLVVGATLVPGPVGSTLVGSDLGDFLAAQQVTALCCVPTLLATLDAELPALRYIMVSGEACPQDLVARWQRPGRRFLNAYGPTESTVTATLNEMVAGRPVTIGTPLPTYSIVILEPGGERALAFGLAGEIAIAGIGISKGYLNRDDLTGKVFVPDFLHLENNASGLLYRTGDLGRINAEGEIEYLGRIDTQVKIRGYRIELTEIESVLMQRPEIAQAVVDKYAPEPGAVELVAYYTLKLGSPGLSVDALVAELRAQLPSYMVPAFYEELAKMPLLPSHKADRKSLPKPSKPRYAGTAGTYVPPANATEEVIATTLASLLKIERVSVEDHFFDALGANSLLMAQFSSRLRETTGSAGISMRDIYLFPTVRQLAAHVAAETIAPPNPAAAEPVAALRAPAWQYYLCGAAQLAWILGYAASLVYVGVTALGWTLDATGFSELYLRGLFAGAGFLLLLVGLPVLLKWLLVGRWTARKFPIWGFAYFRFWLVKSLLRANPMVLLAGSPLYLVYLRALGMKIGRNVVIASASVPVCTDLVTVGDNTIIHKEVRFSGYRARAGAIETGPITIGARAFVAEATVLDIDTVMGNDTQLGMTSSLQRGQRVPDGQRYQGSPAQETTVNYNSLPPLPVSGFRRVLFSLLQLVVVFGVAPLLPALLYLISPALTKLVGDTIGTDTLGLDLPASLGVAFGVSLVLYAGTLLVGLVGIGLLPRLANLFLRPGQIYPLYGFHHFMFGAVTRLSNSKGFNRLFGDSSAIVHYLSFIGQDLGRMRQTGSNFGTNQKHESPFLCAVGSGTLVADGLAMVNADISNAAVRLSQATIGADNYLGNNIFFPAGARTGANVLLATKVAVPIEGPLRENVGLLGSPAFEIPRSVRRDQQFAALATGPEFTRRLKAKNRSNFGTALIFVAVRWALAFFGVLAVLAAIAAQDLLGTWAFALAAVAMLFVVAGVSILAERLSLGFGQLVPRYCSIYDPYFWRHELHWKLSDSTEFMAPFNGTPFKPVLWRLMGVRIGRQVFDDGASMSERTLIEIGDYVTLGEAATLQPHTLEDGAFKSDRIVIGHGASIGGNAFVNYGVEIGEGAVLMADSFLMKGATMPAGSLWGGNPANQLRA